MKKKLFLLTTFLISFVMFASNVRAECKELTCIYPHGITQAAVKLIQYNDCSVEIYRHSYLTLPEIYDPNWEKVNISDLKEYTVDKEKRYWSSEQNAYLACPYCVNLETTKVFEANDGTVTQSSILCGDFYVKLSSDGEYNEAKSQEEIEQDNKIGKENEINEKIKEGKNYCKYSLISDSSNGSGTVSNNSKGSLEIYYNNNDFEMLRSKTSVKEYEFSLDEFLKKNDGICPINLYSLYTPELGETSITLNKKANTTRIYALEEQKYVDDKKNNQTVIDVGDDPCKLFTDDTIDLINDIMNVIKIAVPILLLVFGMVDFLRATFSNSEDDMKKIRDKFFKRIIAAIIVFIVPIFVNLVLKLANTVWPNIKPETCLNSEE